MDKRYRSLWLAAALAACTDPAIYPGPDVANGDAEAERRRRRPDLGTAPDATAPSDLATARDLAAPPDLRTAADLAAPPSDGAISGTVREVGVGRPYSTIQAAVNAAAQGDTVLVHAGLYREQVELIRGVHIVAAGDGAATIDGDCNRAHGIRISGAGSAEIKGLIIQNTVEATILLEDGAHHTTIDGNTLHDFDCTTQGPENHAGIAAWYAGSNTRITNNAITFTVGIARPMKGGGDGIWFKSNDANPSGGGHYIAGNTITGGWDGIGGEEEGSAHGTFDGDTIVENNVVRDTWDDCIQVEGGDQNVRVRNNDVSGCGTGIAFAAPVSGPLYIENNRIHDLSTGLYGNLMCFKVGHPSSAQTFLTGNRCVVNSAAEQAQGGANGIQQTNGSLGPITSRNNVFQVSRYVLEMPEGIRPNGESFDNDCMGTTDSSRFIKWAGSTTYSSLAAFRSATGHESGGTQSSSCPL